MWVIHLPSLGKGHHGRASQTVAPVQPQYLLPCSDGNVHTHGKIRHATHHCSKLGNKRCEHQQYSSMPGRKQKTAEDACIVWQQMNSLAPVNNRRLWCPFHRNRQDIVIGECCDSCSCQSVCWNAKGHVQQVVDRVYLAPHDHMYPYGNAQSSCRINHCLQMTIQSLC